MPFSDQLLACREYLQAECSELPAPYPAVALFFSVSDGEHRAHVVHSTGADLESAWLEGSAKIEAWMAGQQIAEPWLRVDWVEGARAVSWERLIEQLALTKRNYFRFGIAFDADFSIAFTEQELNANAMLYGGAHVEHAIVNRKNFAIYARARFGAGTTIGLPPVGAVYLLAMRGVFCQPDGVLHPLCGIGLNAGRREVEVLDTEAVRALIESGSSYLGRQVKADGLFVYGYFPCFDRQIPTYNTLRHASSLYAMVEAWELTRDDTLREAIDRAVEQLAHQLIRIYAMPDGRTLAFLVDTGNEIKLGGNAVCLLALVKYSEVMKTARWLPLLEQLALGMEHMQDPATGRFDHVLNAHDLSLKDASRIIYYDGEAAFGLMRLYGLTHDPRWLAVVEKAFEHFIANEHWRAHDHWLSYCVNELTQWRPAEKYFRFGIRNFAGHLDFVLERKTTFPTLLELMLAAQQMVERLQRMSDMRHLLDEVDIDKFYRALDHRAHYLLNGFFWPELAMYFKRPSAVAGSFFIRHQSFRVRIDDVEHYLSGFVAYHRFLQGMQVDASAVVPPAEVAAERSGVSVSA